MNNVNINYSTAGLGTPAIGEDFISGLIFYTNAYPSGFSASANTAEIFSIDEAEDLGITLAAAVSASTNIDVIHYHIDEFFRANPTGDLWVMITTGTSASSSFSEIVTLQNAAGGKLRQVGIYEQVNFSAATLSTIQTQIDSCVSDNKPLEALYQANFSGVSTSAFVDLSTSTAKNVTALLGQDGAAVGAGLYNVIGKSIGTVGLTLGAISRAAVNQSIAWVQNFQMSTTELDTLAFANGALLSTLTDSAISAVDAKRYVFLRKFVGIGGSYFNNDYTSIINTNTYSTIHLNRTIHKASRNVRTALLPSISAPIYFNTDGSIALYSILFFKAEAESALAAMVSAGEISQYKVIINAKQNVLSTRNLVITIQLIPVGVADTITVNIGFVLAI